jgi:hypothetical protein
LSIRPSVVPASSEADARGLVDLDRGAGPVGGDEPDATGGDVQYGGDRGGGGEGLHGVLLKASSGASRGGDASGHENYDRPPY